MAHTRDIRIKVTPLQFEIIKNKAQLSGAKTVSEYIRTVVLADDFSIEKLVEEIHDIIVKQDRR